MPAADDEAKTSAARPIMAPSEAARPAAFSQREIAGFGFIAITTFGWGFNWPVAKFLLSEWPPLAARGFAGLIGAVLLACLVKMQGQSLVVPRQLWSRLVVTSFLALTIWVACIGFSLLWLNASETALISATMPIWVSLFAWPMLGEPFSATRGFALALALAALAYLFGAQGVAMSAAKAPGIAFAFVACIGVSIGTILVKRWPLPLPPLSLAAWQMFIGCVPMALAAIAFEHPQFGALSTLGWAAIAYSVLIQFCLCYAAWLAGLERLPASTTSIAMLMIPVVGVLASAALLGEPLGVPQVVAMVLTMVAVVLAVRS